MLGSCCLPESTRMRIAQIAPPWLPVPPPGYGGTELVVSLLCDGLTDRGHSVTLFATGDSRTKARLEYVLERGSGLHAVESLRDEARHALFALRNSSQFDIIHVHSPFMGLTLAALTGRPVVHTVHGWPEMNGIFNVVGDRAWFVAPTKSYASVLPRTPHLEVIHHGIDMTRYPFRDKKEEFVAFVGRATPEKGLHLAISAARRARMRLVAVVTRIGHGWEKQYWDKEVAPLLGGDITIREEVGFDEKVDLLSRARALLFPIAWDEPFGLVMVEAMACGTPVVGTKRASVPEIVDHGVNGYVLPLSDFVDLASGILAEEVARLKPMACRAAVEERFDQALMVQRYEDLYRRSLGDLEFPAAASTSRHPRR